jgi:hypothetical protein
VKVIRLKLAVGQNLTGFTYVEVPAFILDYIPGLAIHRALKLGRSPGSNEQERRGNWTITHTESGMQVGDDIGSRRKACDILRRVKEEIIVDWTLPREAFHSDPNLAGVVGEVRQIVRELR